MNRNELEEKVGSVMAELLREKNFISPVDVFIRLGYLSQKDYES